MKQIVLIIFTFSGICMAYAQQLPLKALETEMLAAPKPNAKLVPNPASNKVEITLSGFEPGLIRIQLVDALGNILRDDKRLLYSGDESLMLMFNAKPGIYFVCIRQHQHKLRKRLVLL
ncbi:MAG: T9SS type A sorting domain-containing protein [Chitinophagaceae bacterium]